MVGTTRRSAAVLAGVLMCAIAIAAHGADDTPPATPPPSAAAPNAPSNDDGTIDASIRDEALDRLPPLHAAAARGDLDERRRALDEGHTPLEVCRALAERSPMERRSAVLARLEALTPPSTPDPD